MTDDFGPEPLALPRSQVLHIDRVCDRFESVWRAGQRPHLQQFLDDTPEPGRSVLLRELQAIERSYSAAEASSPAADPPSTVHPTIPGYVLHELVGQGGMGAVYRAEQLRLHRQVALKIGLGGRTGWERFQLEAEAVARLEHPHIVRIYDFGEWDGLPYYSMEWVAGGDLARKLSQEAIRVPAAVELAAQLADAMHYAHQRGIVHRDLKPANVLLQADGSSAQGLGIPKITDFGLSKCLERDRGLTESEQILGTVRYMAPEQAGGKASVVGPRSDIYSLGAILYELLTGRPPFQGETWLETLDQVRFQPLMPPSRLRKDVPADVEAICIKCLAKDSEQRYASADLLADELRRCRNVGGTAVSPPLTGSRRAAWWMAAVLTACSLLLTIAIGTVAWLRSPSSPPTTATVSTTASVEVLDFRISHHRGEEAIYLGDLGSVSDAACCNDDVRVQVRLNRAAHSFLIAFNPDGGEQLCYPTNPDQPPPASATLEYPSQPTSYFGLTDGAGLQVFVLVASGTPWPAYNAWRTQFGVSPWRRVAARGVWQFDGQGLRLLSGQRGTERQRGAPPTVLRELVDFLAERCRGAELRLLAFPVASEE